MTTPPLDPKKLLGFKLISRNPPGPAAAIAIKCGGKTTDVQLGIKTGEKAGVKGIGVMQHS